MKQRTKIALLAGLMLAAAGVFYFDSIGGSLPGSKTQSLGTVPYLPLPVENPALRRWKLDASRHTDYKTGGRDLFSEFLPPPPAPKRQPAPAPVVQVPVEPPPPTLPANMKYFGYGTVPNGTSRRAFLTDGEEPLVVAEGDTLLGRFRILKINNASLEFEEISSGRRNSIPLDEQAAPPS
jgi:hypothetical protein